MTRIVESAALRPQHNSICALYTNNINDCIPSPGSNPVTRISFAFSLLCPGNTFIRASFDRLCATNLHSRSNLFASAHYITLSGGCCDLVVRISSIHQVNILHQTRIVDSLCINYKKHVQCNQEFCRHEKRVFLAVLRTFVHFRRTVCLCRVHVMSMSLVSTQRLVFYCSYETIFTSTISVTQLFSYQSKASIPFPVVATGSKR